jgi:hypothetical protein
MSLLENPGDEMIFNWGAFVRVHQTGIPLVVEDFDPRSIMELGEEQPKYLPIPS